MNSLLVCVQSSFAFVLSTTALPIATFFSDGIERFHSSTCQILFSLPSAGVGGWLTCLGRRIQHKQNACLAFGRPAEIETLAGGVAI